MMSMLHPSYVINLEGGVVGAGDRRSLLHREREVLCGIAAQGGASFRMPTGREGRGAALQGGFKETPFFRDP